MIKNLFILTIREIEKLQFFPLYVDYIMYLIVKFLHLCLFLMMTSATEHFFTNFRPLFNILRRVC